MILEAMIMAKRPTKEKLYQRAIVAKRNVLNEIRSTSMTIQELRFFSIYLSKINPWDVSTRIVRFPIEDFQRIMEFGRLNIKQLKASTNSLLCKVVNLPTETGGYIGFQLFKECKVDRDKDGHWYIEIDAHDRALPLMFEFKNRYFKYELWNALRLKSPKQVRMYEILKQYEELGRRELIVQVLRELLGIAPTEYAGRTGWSDFKKYVLDSCQQALKETTDICYTYERGQTGRGGKWLSIVFHIRKNTEYIDQLTLEEFIEQQPNPEGITEEESDCSEFLSETDIENEDEDEKWERIYGSERIAQLAGACKYEFDKQQMDVILGLMRDIPIPPDRLTNDLHFGMVFWLTDMYSKFSVAARQAELYGEPIKNRYRYFCRMIENYNKDGVI